MIFYTDAQTFENRKPKESYIAVMREDEMLIFFIRIPYHLAHYAEGLALYQALRFIESNELYNATIYTDSLIWSGIVNQNTKLGGHSENKVRQKEIGEALIQLKEKYNVTIHWKRRDYNKAGHFLGAIWRHKKEYRQQLQMLEPIWYRL